MYCSLACRTLGTVCQRIGSKEDVWCDAWCLQSEPTFAIGQRPCLIHWIVVPLPLQRQLIAVKMVAIDYGFLLKSLHRNRHWIGNLTIPIGQDRPSVEPANGFERWCAPHSAAVLEDDTIPMSVGCIDNGALSHTAFTSKFGFKNNLFLVWPIDMVCTIAHFTTRMSIGPRYHLQVVFTIMLNHARAFK